MLEKERKIEAVAENLGLSTDEGDMESRVESEDLCIGAVSSENATEE